MTDQKPHAFLVKIESSEPTPLYWLELSVPFTCSLQDLDQFIRKIWLETDESLSYFILNNKNYFSVDLFDGEDDFTMQLKVDEILAVGQKFKYYFDRESTILSLDILGEACHDSSQITLIKRNEDPKLLCSKCPALATHIRSTDKVLLCPKCMNTDVSDELYAMSGCKTKAEKAELEELVEEQYEAEEEESEEDFDAEDDDYFEYFGVEDEPEYYLLFNSPRSGVNGYLGPKE